MSWDVPALESLAGSKAYILRKRLNDGGTLTREEKDWITREVNHNTYFKDSIPLLGYRFNFVDVLKTFRGKAVRALHGIQGRGQDEHTLHVVRQSGKDCRIIKSGRRKPPYKKNITMKIIYKSYMARPAQTLRGVGLGSSGSSQDGPCARRGEKRVQNPFRDMAKVQPRHYRGTQHLHHEYRDTTTRAGRDTPQEQLA